MLVPGFWPSWALACDHTLIAGRGLGVTEQRYRAVLEVLEERTPVTEVARRYGVARQTVHQGLARDVHGLAGGRR